MADQFGGFRAGGWAGAMGDISREKIAQRQVGVSEGNLALQQQQFKAQQSEMLRKQNEALAQESVARMEQLGKALEGNPELANSPATKAMMEKERSIMEKALQAAGRDPEIASVAMQQALMRSQLPGEQKVVPSGATVIGPTGKPTFQNQPLPPQIERDIASAEQRLGRKLTEPEMAQKYGIAPKAGPTVEIPGEYGTTRISMGGTAPQGAVQAPAGQTGKPMPPQAQDAISQGFLALDNLSVLEKNVGESGRLKGLMSEAQVFFGANQEAIDFKTAQAQMKLQAQALIKGIPSNFDVKTLIETLPDLTQPENVNRSRINASNKAFKQLLADTISYYKYTGTRIPENIVAAAEKRGINVKSVPSYKGEGDPFQKSQEAVESAYPAPKDEKGAKYIGKKGNTLVYKRLDGSYFGVREDAGED